MYHFIMLTHLLRYFSHYTVTSQPEDDFYQVTVKRLVDLSDPHNKDHIGFYSNYLHSLKVGDTIHCGAIYGPNLLSSGDTNRVAAFVSIGIGLTPTKAMMPLAMKTRPRVAVFHGNSEPGHQAYKGLEDEVKKSGGIYSASYSHVEGGERLTGKKILDTLKASGIEGPDKVDFYICAGNHTMGLYDQLLALGINKDCIHSEYFGPFQSPPE
jgi:ferredoxin-NADP reductase